MTARRAATALAVSVATLAVVPAAPAAAVPPLSLHGSGTNVPMGGASGFLDGSCGPFVYTGCVFTLSPTTRQIGCPTSVGTA